jgi:hypothetical protein
MLGLLAFHDEGGPLMEGYAGRQFVGMDLHRRRSVLVRMTAEGEVLERVRIVNAVDSLAAVIARAGEGPGGGVGGHLRLVLGGGCAARAGRGGALGASAGGEGV